MRSKEAAVSDEKSKSPFQKASVAVVAAGAIMAGGWNMRDYMAQIEILEAKVTAAETALGKKEEDLQAKIADLKAKATALAAREAALKDAEEAGKQLEADYQGERDLWAQRIEALAEELDRVRRTSDLALEKGRAALGMPPPLKGFKGYVNQMQQKR
jgi:outer membrane murein-binding lipoprotein Lpp